MDVTHENIPADENIPAEAGVPTARTAFVLALPSEGALCAPPLLVQQHWAEGHTASEQFWLASSPVSDPEHELSILRNNFRILAELLAERPAAQVPEVFEMPPAPTIRVRMRVHKIGPAPFVFVDDLADEVTPQGQ